MFNHLNNLGIRARLLLGIALFICTLLFAMYNAWTGLGANIIFAQKERLGNYYQRPLASILYNASRLRVELAASASRYDSASSETIIENVSSAMSTLKQVQENAGEALQFTDEGLASRGRESLKYETVRAKWESLAGSISRNPSPSLLGELESFISDIRGMIAHSGDTSNLILDPDLDSYYLMDITLLAMPQTIDRLGSIGSAIYPAILKNADQEPEDLVKYAVFESALSESDIARIGADFETSFNEDPNFYGISPFLKKNLEPLILSYNSANKAFAGLLREFASGDFSSGKDFRHSFDTSLESAYRLLDASYDELDAFLDYRIADYRRQQYKTLIISLLGIASSMIFYLLIARSLTLPLNNLAATMDDISKGKLEIAIPYTGSRSEIGKMAKALDIFKANALETVRLRQQQSETERAANEEKKATMQMLANEFDSQVGKLMGTLAGAVSQMREHASAMQRMTEETMSSTTKVQKNSMEASENVNSVATATEEMTAAGSEISSQVSSVASRASNASLIAEKTSGTVSELANLVSNIGEVVLSIKNIADQTNLLALNATIEAARAGTYGKGFAVVADEVKKLASETSSKTDEIDTRITRIQSATSEAVTAMQEIIRHVSEIDSLAASAAAAVEEQIATNAEITRNVASAAEITGEVSSIIGEVHEYAEGTGKSARQVLTSIENVADMSDKISASVASFLQYLRSERS